jgi:CRP/FNR family transcriptional regulator, dissimilatory nitrate respiration regulator
MYEKWLDTLRYSPLFKSIDSRGLNTMLDCLKPELRSYRQREIIALRGQTFIGIGIILNGRLAVTRETYSGNRVILEILSTGDIFGEVVAFSGGSSWPVTVISQENSLVLFLSPEKITGNCSNTCISHTILIKNMLTILSSKAMMLNRKIEQFSYRSVRGKVSSYLLELSRYANNTAVTIPMKRHELADYLAVPRPSLSRELGAMRDAGIIEFNGHSVKIKKMLVLEDSVQ